MANKSDKCCSSLPVAAMFYMAVFSALIVGGSFEVIKYWPLPVSVVPVMGFKGGAIWGAVAGGLFGLILGFVTDEKHFEESNS
ncbi:MAG TPA: hypothetical protein PKN86_22465 [Candidatus Obscuribacter sp.]|nr:hypothetical protein [Candidatus Obscuribacter sp.]MBK9278867.1 hypothetical protein [Candidatus Obscuribacter sp.]MBL8082062.1 hypothetical protein [Candidatus Obscuribacter sp.]HND08367.1 hypothetical protein [Candidatus Obscuribacter sp.]HNM52504.1 hypothetical protein [Candidatus Obscuribacter sp.]